MGEGGVATLAKAKTEYPSLAIPARNGSESLMRDGSDNLSIFSSLLAENEAFTECKPFSSLLAGNLGSPVFSSVGTELPIVFNNLGKNGNDSVMQTGNKKSGLNGMGESQEHVSSSFRARYKSMMPSKLPIPSTSAYFTIPPGLSPATLLDSPVLFTAGLAASSPTTGSLSNDTEKPQDSRLPASAEPLNDKETSAMQQDNFIFKPHAVTTCQRLSVIDTGCFGTPYEAVLQHSEESQVVPRPQVDALIPQVDALIPTFESTHGHTSGFVGGGSEYQKPRDSAIPLTRCPEMVSTSQVSDVAQYVVERTVVDGYNWKKYGQKQLKGTEFPRSYYKCTHPDCPVKKQVECSLEGEITEIMYKGQHNHDQPQGTRRGARKNSSAWERPEEGIRFLALECAGETECAGEVSSANNRMDSDRLSTNLSSLPLALPHGSCVATPEQCFGSPSTEEGEDGESSKADDDCDDERNFKRRRTETLKATLSSEPIRTIREPRVMVQTTSEIDVLDDGYRWRKYGQKVVKGNRFPRNYYKCTNVGCAVRKHVERSSTDPMSVITAYEGKHNHSVPVARGRASAGPPSLPPYTALDISTSADITSSMLYERPELATFAESRINRGKQFNAGMVSMGLPDFDRYSSLSVAQAMGLTLAGMRPFAAGNLHAAPGSGLSALQPDYPSSLSACVKAGHL